MAELEEDYAARHNAGDLVSQSVRNNRTAETLNTGPEEEDQDYLLRPNTNHQRGFNAQPNDERPSTSESESSDQENDDGVETMTDALGNTVIKT